MLIAPTTPRTAPAGSLLESIRQFTTGPACRPGLHRSLHAPSWSPPGASAQMHDRSWYHLASRVCGSHPGRTTGKTVTWRCGKRMLACSRPPASGNGAATMWLTPRVARSMSWSPFTLTPVTDLRRPAGSGPECRPSTGSCSCFLTTRLWVPGCFKVSYDKNQVKDAPSLSTDGEPPGAGGE